MIIEKNSAHLGDCLEIMPFIEDDTIDMVLADLPYGTTNCKWDTLVPLHDHVNKLSRDKFLLHLFSKGVNYREAIDEWLTRKEKGLWYFLNKKCKERAAIAMFAQTPFDKVLGDSNKKDLRYEWIWQKTHPTGHLNAKRMPMKAHENILIFYKKLPTYNPQKTTGHERKVSLKKHKESCDSIDSPIYSSGQKATSYDSTERYPLSVLKFPSDKQKSNLHPTQKPVDLLRYFIRTYTNTGDTILDMTSGSATTAIACLEEGRKYIVIEKEQKYFEIGQKRIADWYKVNQK